MELAGRSGMRHLGSASWRRPPGTFALIGGVPGAIVTRICEGRIPCAALPDGGEDRGAFGLHQFCHWNRTDAEWRGLIRMVLVKWVAGNTDALQVRSWSVSAVSPVRIEIMGRPVRRQEVVPVLVSVSAPTIV